MLPIGSISRLRLPFATAASNCIRAFAGVTSAVMNVGRVGRLWRYPVKSMRGEECREIEVGARGFEGDRVFALQDAAGKLGSGKDTRRFRNLDGLLAFCARYGGDASRISTTAPCTW
jgi:hypothetical protein